jgi:hypothetical protein
MGMSLVMEVVLMAILTLCLLEEMILKHRYPIGYLRCHREFLPILAAATLVGWVDLVYFMLRQQTSLRLSPWVRLVMTWIFPRVRWIVPHLLAVLPNVTQLFAYVAGTIALFAWFLSVIVDDHRDQLDDLEGDDSLGASFFHSYSQSVVTLINIAGGNDFPDKMLPMFMKARWIAFILVAFMVIVWMMLENIALAVVYESFSKSQHESLEEMRKKQFRSLMAAYFLLMEEEVDQDGEYLLTHESFDKLIDVLYESPKMQALFEKSNATAVFADLDEDDSDTLGRKQFLNLCDELMLGHTIVERDSLLVKSTGEMLRPLQAWVENGNHDILMSVLIWINACCILFDSILDLNNITSAFPADLLEFLFACVYVMDVFFRLSLTSFEHYWHCSRNKFDFFSSWILFFMAFSAQLGKLDADYARYFNMARVLRGLFVLEYIPQLRGMFTSIKDISMVSVNVLILLSLTLFTFCIVGIQLWGGVLHAHNPALQGSAYLGGGYDAMNFNEPAMAMLALFANLVMGFSGDYSDGFGRVSRFYFIGPMYCASFLVVTMLLIFNIFVARLIDNWGAVQKVSDSFSAAQDKSQGSKSLQESLARDGKLLIVSLTCEALEVRSRMAIFDLYVDLDAEFDMAAQIVAPPEKVHHTIHRARTTRTTKRRPGSPKVGKTSSIRKKQPKITTTSSIRDSVGSESGSPKYPGSVKRVNSTKSGRSAPSTADARSQSK